MGNVVFDFKLPTLCDGFRKLRSELGVPVIGSSGLFEQGCRLLPLVSDVRQACSHQHRHIEPCGVRIHIINFSQTQRDCRACWVTVVGCVAVSVLFAFALLAV